MTPDKLVRPEVLAMSAYHVADAEGMVKLDAMENPYPLPEPLRRELAQVLARVALNRYPEPNPPRLRELIRRRMAVPAGMEILLGNGSDDLIQVLAMALAREGATMMYPAPTFVVYGMSATFMLEHLDVLEAQAGEIRTERAKLYAELSALPGVTVFPSAANFFLIRVADAARSYEALRRQGVLVRNLHPGLANCLRITVGT